MADTPRFSVSNAFSGGWWALKQRYWLLVLGAVMCMSAEVVRMGIARGAGHAVSHHGHSAISSWVGALLAVFATIPLWLGLINVAVRTIRGQSTGAADLLSGFVRYREVVPTVLVAGLAMLVAWVIGVVSLAVVGSAFGPLVIFPFFVFVAVMLLLTVALVPACVMAVDEQSPNQTVIERIRTGFDRAMLRPVSLVWLLIVLAIMAGATVLLAGIGFVLLGLPLAATVIGAAYVLITAPSSASESERREPLTPFPSII